MTSLREAFDTTFAAGRPWAVEALDRLGMSPDDDTPVRHVAQGWMRLGGDRDALLVDTLFVLTDDRLGFGQTHIATADPNWIELSSIVALDLIEGVPYPLEAIEVQFAGGMAIFVGWPDDLSGAVLEALAGQGRAPADPVIEPAFEAEPIEGDDADDDAEVGELLDAAGNPIDRVDSAADLDDDSAGDLDGEPATAGSEPTASHATTPFAAGGDAPGRPVMPPLFAALERTDDGGSGPATAPASEGTEQKDVESIDDDRPATPTPASPLSMLGAPTSPFAPDDRPGTFLDDLPSSEAEDRFFADLEDRDEPDEPGAMFSVSAPEPEVDIEVPDVPEGGGPVRGPWDDPAMPWPDPIRNCVFLGGHPVHQRRRKNVVIVMRAGGLVVANSGSGGWSFHVPWHEVRRIDVQGADEVKFTHNHRIDLNGSALVVELADSTWVLVEIRGRRPATVRSALAPVISMANASTQAGGSDFTSF